MPKKTKTQSSQQNRLAEPMRDWAIGAGEGATALYEDPAMANLPGGYVGMSDQRQDAYTRMVGPYDYGNSGRAGINEWEKVMSGGYLDAGSNPYLQDIVKRSTEAGQAPISGAFNQGGRYGSGAFAAASINASAETAERLYGAEYRNERQNMMTALSQTGNIQAIDERLRNPQIEEAQRLEYVGQQYEADDQAKLAEENRQFMWPYMQQQIYESSLGSNPLVKEGDSEMQGSTTEPFDWGAMVGGLFSGPSM